MKKFDMKAKDLASSVKLKIYAEIKEYIIDRLHTLNIDLNFRNAYYVDYGFDGVREIADKKDYFKREMTIFINYLEEMNIFDSDSCDKLHKIVEDR